MLAMYLEQSLAHNKCSKNIFHHHFVYFQMTLFASHSNNPVSVHTCTCSKCSLSRLLPVKDKYGGFSHQTESSEFLLPVTAKFSLWNPCMVPYAGLQTKSHFGSKTITIPLEVCICIARLHSQGDPAHSPGSRCDRHYGFIILVTQYASQANFSCFTEAGTQVFKNHPFWR